MSGQINGTLHLKLAGLALVVAVVVIGAGTASRFTKPADGVAQPSVQAQACERGAAKTASCRLT